MLYTTFPPNQPTLSAVADTLIENFCFEYYGIFALIYCKGSITRDRLKKIYFCNDQDIDNLISAGYLKEIK